MECLTDVTWKPRKHWKTGYGSFEGREHRGVMTQFHLLSVMKLHPLHSHPPPQHHTTVSLRFTPIGRPTGKRQSWLARPKSASSPEITPTEFQGTNLKTDSLSWHVNTLQSVFSWKRLSLIHHKVDHIIQDSAGIPFIYKYHLFINPLLFIKPFIHK